MNYIVVLEDIDNEAVKSLVSGYKGPYKISKDNSIVVASTTSKVLLGRSEFEVKNIDYELEDFEKLIKNYQQKKVLIYRGDSHLIYH